MRCGDLPCSALVVIFSPQNESGSQHASAGWHSNSEAQWCVCYLTSNSATTRNLARAERTGRKISVPASQQRIEYNASMMLGRHKQIDFLEARQR